MKYNLSTATILPPYKDMCGAKRIGLYDSLKVVIIITVLIFKSIQCMDSCGDMVQCKPSLTMIK